MNGRTGAEGLTGAGEPGDEGEPAGVDRSRPSRRKVVVGTALAGIAGALPLGGGSAYADGAGPRLRAAAEAVLRSDVLEVRADTAFPRVVSYTDRGTGAVLYGQS
ncbi:hypothetical protein, partial [Streptomyces rimosus]